MEWPIKNQLVLFNEVIERAKTACSNDKMIALLEVTKYNFSVTYDNDVESVHVVFDSLLVPYELIYHCPTLEFKVIISHKHLKDIPSTDCLLKQIHDYLSTHHA